MHYVSVLTHKGSVTKDFAGALQPMDTPDFITLPVGQFQKESSDDRGYGGRVKKK